MRFEDEPTLNHARYHHDVDSFRGGETAPPRSMHLEISLFPLIGDAARVQVISVLGDELTDSTTIGEKADSIVDRASSMMIARLFLHVDGHNLKIRFETLP